MKTKLQTPSLIEMGVRTPSNSSKSLIKPLRKDYFQILIDFENKFQYDKSYDIIKELTTLYQEGIEYYSAYDLQKQDYFNLKLHELFMNKKTIQNMSEMNESKRKIKEQKLSKNRSSKLTNRNSFVILPKTEYGRTTIIRRKIKQRKMENKIIILEKIKRNRKIEETKESSLFPNYVKNIEKANQLIEKELISQQNSFKHLKIIKQKFLKNQGRNRMSLGVSYNNEKQNVFDGNENMIDEDEEESIPRSRRRIITMFKRFSVKIEKSKKMVSLNKLFENFLLKFQEKFIFLTEDNFIKKALDLSKETYKLRIENYLKYENDIIELEIFFREGNESMTNKRLELMKNTLDLEREKFDMTLISQFLQKYTILREDASKKQFVTFLKIQDIIHKLVTIVINMTI